MAKTLVALYGDMDVARRTHRDLAEAGFSDDDIGFGGLGGEGRFRWMSGTEASRSGDGISEGRDIDPEDLRQALREDGVPDDDADLFVGGIRQGGTLLLLHADDESAEEAALIMERHRMAPAAVEEQITEEEVSDEELTEEELAAELEEEEPITTAPLEGAREGGEVRVPLAEEEVHVGKRVIATGGVRVHTRTREVPVTETLRLRTEHVSVERRAVDRPIGPGEEVFEDRTVEMQEEREEPVVAKEAHIAEEVVVRKEVEEREEEVHETARKQEVEIERRAGETPEQRPQQRPEQRPEQR